MRRYIDWLGLLIVILLLGTMVSAQGTHLTQQQYSELFHQTVDSTWESELTETFIAAPEAFTEALAQEKYGVQYDTAWALANSCTEEAHKEVIINLAEVETLSQAQRRIVRWLLTACEIREDYLIFGESVDYQELFSHAKQTDGAFTSMWGYELQTAFLKDPNTFVTKLEEQDAANQKHIIDSALFDMCYSYGQAYIEEILEGVESAGQLNAAQLQVLDKMRDTVIAFSMEYENEETPAATESASEIVPKDDPAQADPKTPPAIYWVVAPVLIVSILAVVVFRKRRA